MSPSSEVPSASAVTESLVAIGRWLQSGGYDFTTVSPATHARVNARPEARLARDLRDVFGWSRPFQGELLPAHVLATLRGSGLVQEQADGLLRSRVRFSTLDGRLYAHSAYPTTDEDAVFFGPDTYRFAAWIADELAREPVAGAGGGSPRLLDLGCGGGPGGLVAAQACADAHPALVLADINPRALQFARANAALADAQDVVFAQGDLYAAVEGAFDLIVSNPPYLNDAAQRTYRHGGGEWGEGLSERIVREGLERLAPGGRLLLYTGAAMVDARDPLLESLRPALEKKGWRWRYRELDPDVFGEELSEPAYARAERIAAVALSVRRP
ncbi:methyltransferase [Ramlibacter sp. Leaf400]|uniref:methyltransferase n=1 Tax=Ramlibacter sp. Leaf400 TaxID=1736365 RepID=UPI0006FEFC62|nr:methyltransferase [Ramlibacter sp. Leaf400]KQT08080.1 hypothetical protein ASG30_16770 [Ramlibacter sp. Leaf400]